MLSGLNKTLSLFFSEQSAGGRRASNRKKKSGESAVVLIGEVQRIPCWDVGLLTPQHLPKLEVRRVAIVAWADKRGCTNCGGALV